jgi:hypothetical protein
MKFVTHGVSLRLIHHRKGTRSRKVHDYWELLPFDCDWNHWELWDCKIKVVDEMVDQIDVRKKPLTLWTKN